MNAPGSEGPEGRSRAFPGLLVGADGILVSDLCSLGVVCYAADRLWYASRFSPGAWVAVTLVWTAAAAAGAAWDRSRGNREVRTGRRLAPPLAAAACALAVRVFASPFTWAQAGAFALLLCALLSFSRLILGLMSRASATLPWDGVRLGAAQAVGLFAVHPYLHSGLVGAGDAGSYGLTVSDYIEQVRAGIFPVLIGQSRFAFSGGFQPLRNAPLFPHLAWAFDLLGFHTFNAYALENLTVAASMLGAVLCCLAALRFLVPGAPWACLLLSLLYGLCPGVLAPLYGGDMYITFMVLPFIPWLVLGIERSSAAPEKAWPWLVQSAALAALWLAHPPVAAWASLTAGIAGLAVLIRAHRARVLARMAAAAALFAVLTCYLFVSVRALGLPSLPRAEALASVGYKVSVLKAAWSQALRPVSHGGNNLIGDIQLGYGLMACLILSLPLAASTRSGRALLLCCASILVYAWPIPVVTLQAWLWLPTEMLVVTNQWPVERFYVLLAGFSVFVVALAVSRLGGAGSPARRGAVLLLACACAWSMGESRKFFRRAAATSMSEARSEDSLLAENIVVSRTHSYEYVGTPSTFSNGHMDPRLETRLFDKRTLRVFADGATPLPGPGSDSLPRVLLIARQKNGGILSDPLELGPGRSFTLNFDFLGQNPRGELDVSGGSLLNFYSLPESGRPRAFGSGPAASHRLVVENSTAAPEGITLEFKGTGCGSALARVSARPLNAGGSVVSLSSLTPFHAVVSPDRGCFLETPKLFVPGYEALVDGKPAGILRSAEGLVAVGLAQGRHDVVVSYRGSPALRWSYFGTAAAWLCLFAVVGLYSARREAPLEELAARLGPALRGPLGRTGAAIIGAAAVLAAGVPLARRLHSAAAQGPIRMDLRMPYPVPGRSEPLLTTGRPGAGDTIYVTYIDGGHVSVGHDKWGYGGGRSAPIALDYSKPQVVEVSMSSLLPSPPAAAGPQAPSPLVVRWNGAVVLTEDVAAYPSAPADVAVGTNRIGAATAEPSFTGAIDEVSRAVPGGH